MNSENEEKPGFSDKQVHIIEATERLFAEKGYEGTSVRDIAHNAGVNVAMVSYYFGSKEKLLEAIFVYRISQSKLQLQNLLDNKELNAFQKIDLLIDTYVDKIMRNTHFHRINLQESHTKDMKEIAEMVYRNKVQNLELIKKLIQEGQRSEEFRRGVDSGMLIATMLGTSNYMLTNIAFYRRQNGLEEKSEEVVHKHLKKKLTAHLKLIFKTFLTHEG